MKEKNSTTKPSKIIELLTTSIRIRRSKKVLIVFRSEFAEANRNKVGASRWLATSGSPEQFGWLNRSHTGKECATHAVRVSHRLTPTRSMTE